MASRIASFVGSVQLRLKIEQATSTEDEPTPIYLLDEVLRDIGSGSKNVADAVEVIQQRLQHRLPTVKQKALKLVKHAAQKGSPELRRSLARHSSAVRDLTHFRCAPDPFKGDIPWKRVQEYAKEALDALHAAPGAAPTSSAPTGALGQSRMQGFGSEGGAGASSGMMGFGSDSVGYSYGGGGGSGVLDAPTQTYRAPLSGGGGGAVFDSLSTGVRDLTDRAVGALTRPQHQRLNSTDSDGYGGYSGEGAGGYGGGGSSAAPVQMDRGAGIVGTPVSPTSPQLTRERRLVDKICAPGGLRAAPAAEDLRSFVSAISGTDGAAVGAALQQKMETGSWQECLRALCALEAVLESNASAAAGEVAVHFHGAVGAVRRAQQSTQATVRQRAERVLRLLGAETLPDASAAPAAAVSAAGQDLLGDDLVLSSNAGTSQNDASAAASAVPADPLDLLAGLEVTGAPPAPAAAPAAGLDPLADLMGGPVAAPVAPAPARAPSEDVFGDWSAPVESAPSLPLPNAGPVPVPPADGFDLLDGLSGLSLSAPPATTGPSMVPIAPAAAAAPPRPLAAPAAPLDDFFSTMAPPAPAPMGSRMGSWAPPPTAPAPPRPGIPSHIPGMSVNDDVLGAINAATSGITSTKREEVAFDFVQGAMAQLKKK